jgi:hypothetical protein
VYRTSSPPPFSPPLADQNTAPIRLPVANPSTHNSTTSTITTTTLPPPRSLPPAPAAKPSRQSIAMAEFVRAQIFGTTFEITSRYDEAPHGDRSDTDRAKVH